MVLQAFYEGGGDFKESLCIAFSMHWGFCLFGVLFCSFFFLLFCVSTHCIVRAMVFPVVMYRCESWTIKKAESQRIEAFETVELEKILESPLDCKEIKLVNYKEIQS